MRAGKIGRWVGRAMAFVALAAGSLAFTGAVANADSGSSEGVVMQQDFDWN